MVIGTSSQEEIIINPVNRIIVSMCRPEKQPTGRSHMSPRCRDTPVRTVVRAGLTYPNLRYVSDLAQKIRTAYLVGNLLCIKDCTI